MEPIPSTVASNNLHHYKPTEYEKERASNSYLMSIVAILVGLPLPIINLIATALFFFGNRKSTKFVRWHCTQALLSQFTIFIINSIGYAWTLRIIFSENASASDSYFAYIIVLVFFNLIEFIVSIVLAIKVRKGEHAEWWLWGTLTNSFFATENKSKNTRQLLVKGLLLAILVGGSYWGLKQITWAETFKINEFTAKKKKQLGNIILDTHRMSHREITGSIHPKINELKNKICIANNIDTSSIQIHIFADYQVNAFAIPGDHIIINTGLLRDCEDPDMVAGVIAHEIGHIENDHVSKKLTKEIGMATLVALAGGTENLGLIKEVLKTLTSKSFDRDYEREADAAALLYLNNANIDPMALASFFEKIAEMQSGMPEAMEWASTHPLPDERAATIKAKTSFNHEYTPCMSAEEWKELQETVELFDHI